MDSGMLAMTLSNADGQGLDLSAMMKDANKKRHRKYDKVLLEVLLIVTMSSIFYLEITKRQFDKIKVWQSKCSMLFDDLFGVAVARLECTQACSLIERNKRLALALEIKNPDFSSKLGTPTYTQFLRDYAK